MAVVQTGLRMPEEIRDKLAAEAKERGVSLNSYLLMLIHRGRAAELARVASHTQECTA